MNSQLARAFFKRSQLSQRFSSGAPFPTTSTVESGGFKVVGLPYLSVNYVSWLLCSYLFNKNQLITFVWIRFLQTPAMRAEYTKTNWLSDPSTYPLLVVLAGAGCLCTGFGCYFLATAPDVQISPLKRSAKSANLLIFLYAVHKYICLPTYDYLYFTL